MSEISAIVLAAGEGKRMKSGTSKVLHQVCFYPLIQWVYNAAECAGAQKIVTVVGHLAEQVKECLGEDKSYAVQTHQLGTGHAVISAMPQLDDGGCVIVLSGDVPLITAQTLESVVKYHQAHRYAATVLTASVDNPAGYGRIIRSENGQVRMIVEEKDATDEQRRIAEINSGIYCFDTGLLRAALDDLKNDNAQGEYYLTDTIDILITNGYNVGAYELENSHEIMGINDRAQLAEAEVLMRKRIAQKLMTLGVTLIDPSNTYIGPDVEVENDVVIYPGCILSGTCRIGEGTVIGFNTRITNAQIGKRCEIESAVITSSTIGDDTHIGPFAYIRPGSVIGDHVKIGDFVEIKNSSVGNGTKVSHLTYVGDSDVGCDVNFGCGTVTVNYDGQKKYRTTIMDRAFIGCNTNLVAPVTIGEGAYTAAGSTITEDVPPNSLAIARSRQSIKENWRLRKMGGEKK